MFGVSEAYLIENGKVTAPVRGATLIGNGVEALRRSTASPTTSTSRAASAARPGSGAAGVGQPHVRIRESRWAGPRERLEQTARRAVEAALAAGATDAEAWARGDQREIRVYEGEVEWLTDAGGRGIGVRSFVDGRWGYAYGTDLSDAGVAELAGRRRPRPSRRSRRARRAAGRVRVHAGRGARRAGGACTACEM